MIRTSDVCLRFQASGESDQIETGVSNTSVEGLKIGKHMTNMKRTFFVSITCPIFSLSIHAQTIVGNWKLTWMVIESDMAYSIIVPVTLSIEENGKIRGNGGCNNFSGSYSFRRLRACNKTSLVQS